MQANSSTKSSAVSASGKRNLFAEWAEMIKLEHTVFALPFALSGLILANSDLPSWTTVGFVLLAFVGARSAAMTLNRLIDANIDKLNPRTAERSIPAGRIKPFTAFIISVAAFGLMLFAASHLPDICLKLSPIAVFWLSFYSFTKRFTWLCHLVLGIALGGAALGGWVASAGTIQGSAPWLLSAAVATWVAGFDIIYACQDFEFDRNQKLHSIPARFGVAKALLFSRLLHVITVSCLLTLGFAINPAAGLFYFLGTALVAAMLVYEHRLVSPTDLSKVNAAFFTVNGVVSIITFLTILLDHLIKVKL
jgi:4-hydroxybenzoate polyprenyltransferase